MRSNLWLLTLAGVASASVVPRQDDSDDQGVGAAGWGGPPPPSGTWGPPKPSGTGWADSSDDDWSPDDKKKWGDKPKKPWKPITSHPEFFSLKVDEYAPTTPVVDANGLPIDPTILAPVVAPVVGAVNNLLNGLLQPPAGYTGCFGTTVTVGGVVSLTVGPNLCKFLNYAVRLENGIVILTPYNKWWDPKLPIFFVDDDTKLYTVSKQPFEIYVDGVTGSLRYAPVGWLPPNAISTSFFKLGTNPVGVNNPSPAHLSWPSTEGRTPIPWYFCPMGGTQQYQVYVGNKNYGTLGPSGVTRNFDQCQKYMLAAVNANPWGQGGGWGNSHPW